MGALELRTMTRRYFKPAPPPEPCPKCGGPRKWRDGGKNGAHCNTCMPKGDNTLPHLLSNDAPFHNVAWYSSLISGEPKNRRQR